MARYSIEDTTLTNIANKIRNKTNSTAAIRVKDWEDAIDSINGEDVTAETNEYTDKIAQLTTVVTALENELAGKAGGDSGIIATSVVTITRSALDSPGAGNGSIYYTNSNGEYVEENISLMPNSSISISITRNTIFFTSATEMSGECQVNGGQQIYCLGGFMCVITEPTATIYLE